MKDLKKKLTASVAMLGVSAVMLSGVSYAWYTLSTNPEVKGISATAVANENLEIALVKNASQKATGTTADSTDVLSSKSGSGTNAQGSSTNDYYTWGNLVDVSSLITETPMELRPATYKDASATIGDSTAATNSGLYYPTYGQDGRIDDFALLKDDVYTNATNGGLKKVNAEYTGSGSSSTTQYAFAVDYWMRTNVNGNISLSTATQRDNTNDNAQGAGSYVSGDAFKTGGAYAKKYDAVKVVFHVVKEDGTEVGWKEATNATALTNDNQVALTCDTIFSADANTAYKVTMYVYLNGEVVTNENAAANVSNLGVNVQFVNSGMKTDNAAMQK